MILFPRIDRQYWIITDIWEKFIALPFIVTDEENGEFLGYVNDDDFYERWFMDDEMPDGEYFKVKRRYLFRTRQAAIYAAAKLSTKSGLFL
jgi:hypothetical protein